MRRKLSETTFEVAESEVRPHWSRADRWRFPAGRVVATGLPVLTVVLFVFTVLGYFGVGIWQRILYAAYETGFIGIPGILVYLALSHRSDRWLRIVSTGWALGYAIEVGCFIITAALGIRGWFVAYPAVVVMLSLPFAIRRYRSSDRIDNRVHRPKAIRNWGLALASVLAITYVSISSFAVNPLPGSVPQVDYYVDLPWSIGNAAELKHHWPLTDPRISGEALPYHTFVYMHLAAISNVTGLELPVVFFRFFIVVSFLLLVVQLYNLGAGAADRWKQGLLSVTLFLFLGEIDPFRTMQFPFYGTAVYYLTISPTYLFGMVLFLPLIDELSGKLVQSALTPRRSWVLILLLMFAAAGAKGSILPIVFGGLVLFMLFTWWKQRRLNIAALCALALVGIGLFLSRLLLFQGSSYSLVIDPLESFWWMKLTQKLAMLLGGLDHRSLAVLLMGLSGVGLIGLMGMTVVGLVGFLWKRSERITPEHLFYLCLLIPGLGALYLLGLDGASQMYFYHYGYVAAAVPAAYGIGRIVGYLKEKKLVIRLAIGTPLILVAAVCAIDLPLDYNKVIQQLRTGAPTYSPLAGVTPDLYRGLVWVRDHTPTDAVIAVDWFYLPKGKNDPGYYYFSAFSERRVFLEGWGCANESHRIGFDDVLAGTKHPFPDRLALNSKVFALADSEALRVMATRYGVTYLIVDKLHVSNPPSLSAITKQVYTNPHIDVYEVLAAYRRSASQPVATAN